MTPVKTTGGVLTVPLTARYIRTGPIGTGSANAKATFTMSYQ
jgi:type 1 fimbria pilin